MPVVDKATPIDLRFLNTPAGFQIGQSFIGFGSSDSVAWALVVGLSNTLMVSALSLAAGTMLGFAAGIAQLSENPAVRAVATAYVNVLRGIPLLLWLFFWYSLLLTQLPPARSALEVLPHTFVSNEGVSLPSVHSSGGLAILVLGLGALFLIATIRRRAIRPTATRILLIFGIAAVAVALLQPDFVVDFPAKTRFRVEGGLRVTTEFAALLLGISLAASSAIAAIVRAGFLAIPDGQADASRALGLTWIQSMRLVLLPQALKAILPPLTSAYASLVKASSLAVAIGFPDLVMVSNTIINQTGQAIECTAIFTLAYLLISMGISSLTQGFFGRDR
jgi:general L-amino acid transport system permease protein